MFYSSWHYDHEKIYSSRQFDHEYSQPMTMETIEWTSWPWKQSLELTSWPWKHLFELTSWPWKHVSYSRSWKQSFQVTPWLLWYTDVSIQLEFSKVNFNSESTYTYSVVFSPTFTNILISKMFQFWHQLRVKMDIHSDTSFYKSCCQKMFVKEEMGEC